MSMSMFLQKILELPTQVHLQYCILNIFQIKIMRVYIRRLIIKLYISVCLYFTANCKKSTSLNHSLLVVSIPSQQR